MNRKNVKKVVARKILRFEMTALPPWHFLKAKGKEIKGADDMTTSLPWTAPGLLNLDKNVRFYRDLLRSTEKVELTLSHSGKKETFESHEDPAEPAKRSTDAKHTIFNIFVRTEQDPRLEFARPDGTLGTRPEYTDVSYLREVLVRRAQTRTPGSSKNITPVGSPRFSGGSPVMVPKKPPPPPPGHPDARPPPPPPPKAPAEKRPRHD